MSPSLRGQASGALVTGAGSGLGARIARLLAERGHTVHVTDLDPDAAARTAEQIGGGAWASALDVRDDDAVQQAARATAERTGRLAVWVNNAGVLFPGPAWEQTAEQRALTIDVNATGVINGTVAAINVMRDQPGGGHIINVASLAGLVAVPGEAVYACSKHAVLGFGLSTAADLRQAGITSIALSSICPDGIWTPMLHDKLDDPSAALSFSGTLLGVEDVVAAVGRVLDRPRPVLTLPRWRGAQVRLIDTFPGVGLKVLPIGVALGKWAQRRLRRRGLGPDDTP